MLTRSVEFRGNLLWGFANNVGWSPSNELLVFLLGDFRFPSQPVQYGLVPFAGHHV